MFSKCQLIKIPKLSGSKGSIYTILIDEEENTSFKNFVLNNQDLFKSEIKDIVSRLKTMGSKTGMSEYFFKLKEGNPGDGVCALYDEENSNLRLYCIRYGSQLIIIGGGGHKPKSIRTFQEDANLERENYILRELSKLITEKMRDREIHFSEDGMNFEGDLTIENLYYE
ncbi:hypothetical protein JBL43_01640 [Aureibaculum sp. A20]|uniref:Uncharacterized protein n=1 Tax=Aureibaculum flavum TaxID=2795986 RepID=A0ABS0WLS0_9FLAO|nr:hypothetical protein [Aureibaculum flavum]MBJ2172920.1 hypothetical protein [Aureibaculum flavum]